MIEGEEVTAKIVEVLENNIKATLSPKCFEPHL